MENQIKHVAARLKVIFISFWLLPVLLIIAVSYTHLTLPTTSRV